MKLDEDGNHLWQKQIGDGPLAAGDQVIHNAASPSGMVGIIGISRSTSMVVDGVVLTHPNNGQQAYFAIMNPNGTWLWGKKLNSVTGGYGYHVQPCSDSDFVFGGFTAGGVDFGNGVPMVAGTANREAFVARYQGFPYPEISAERNGNGIISHHFTVPEALGVAVIETQGALHTITLRNDGTADLTGIIPTLTGEHPGDFLLDASATASTLAPGATTTFTVQFTPTALGTRNASISIASNDYDESPFVVALTGTGVPPEITLAASPSSMAEDGSGGLAFTFTRSGPTTNPLTVDFAVGGTAEFSTDYTQSGADAFAASAGSVTFAAGSATALVTLDPTADPVLEADETVQLTVSPGNGYAVGTPETASATILNDDTEVSVAAAPASLAEDAPGTLDFTFSRVGPTTDPLTIAFTVGGTAGFGTDYTAGGADSFTASTGTVSFAAGSSTAVVTVDPWWIPPWS